MEWTCVSCPTGRFSQAPGLRLRPVQELGVCVVFAPAEARLFRLDAQSWLALELCRDGVSAVGLQAAWREAVGSEDAGERLGRALDLLLANGLLRHEPAPEERALSPAGGGG
jgi:hypothetical protein